MSKDGREVAGKLKKEKRTKGNEKKLSLFLATFSWTSFVERRFLEGGIPRWKFEIVEFEIKK